ALFGSPSRIFSLVCPLRPLLRPSHVKTYPGKGRNPAMSEAMRSLNTLLLTVTRSSDLTDAKLQSIKEGATKLKECRNLVKYMLR
ncbi:MAG TPA: hypothetical protein VK553_08535, partial [Candidatus Nitrosopolaris rasttigaisensis]|nr:hypothetical protein [Candidatus Nitrosopolaris rasttigaisensis]